MKPFAVIVLLVLGAVALALTSWVGRVETAPAVSSGGKPSMIGETDEDIGPKVSATGPHPVAEIDETKYDFGTMQPMEKGSHEFEIRNTGAAPLELMARKEDTTCQCTFGELGETIVPPGGSTKVTVSWQIKNPNRQFRHRASVRTNDPSHRKLDLIIMGTVDRPVMIQPENLWNLGAVVGTTPVTFKGMILSAVFDQFEITEYKIDDPNVTVKWEPMTAEEIASSMSQYPAPIKSGYRVLVTLDPKSPFTTYSQQLELQTNIKSLEGTKGSDDDAEAHGHEGHDHDHAGHQHPAGKAAVAGEATAGSPPADDGEAAGAAGASANGLKSSPVIPPATPMTGPPAAKSGLSINETGVRFTVELRASKPDIVQLAGPGWRTSANLLMLGEFSAAEGKSSDLIMFVRGISDPIHLIETTHSRKVSQVVVEHDESVQGNAIQRFKVKVTVPPGIAANHHYPDHDKVTLKFDHPEMPEVRFGVDFLSR